MTTLYVELSEEMSWMHGLAARERDVKKTKQ
jgi:hypothetical protein